MQTSLELGEEARQQLAKIMQLSRLAKTIVGVVRLLVSQHLKLMELQLSAEKRGHRLGLVNLDKDGNAVGAPVICDFLL
jgi:hypothetical protein